MEYITYETSQINYNKPEIEKKELALQENIPELLKVLGKKYAFEILTSLMREGVLRFNEIVKEVKGNVKTITNRLSELTKLNIITRTFYDEIPPRVEYCITLDNEKLLETLNIFQLWVDFWKQHLK